MDGFVAIYECFRLMAVFDLSVTQLLKKMVPMLSPNFKVPFKYL